MRSGSYSEFLQRDRERWNEQREREKCEAARRETAAKEPQEREKETSKDVRRPDRYLPQTGRVLLFAILTQNLKI